MRTIVVLTFCGCLAACRSNAPLDDYNEAFYHAQISTTLDAALACERGYVRAHTQSLAKNREIADAAIAACNSPISAAVQAYMSDVVARREETLTAAQVEHERTNARADIIKKLHSDATQLLIENRTPGTTPP